MYTSTVGTLPDPASYVILVVDDDGEVRSFLETMLKLEGFQVKTAGGGNEAMAIVNEKAPDLVITDMMMPDSGGFDILREMQSSGHAGIPVILCTARKVDSSTIDMIRREGNVVDFLFKPIAVPALTRAIWNALKAKSRGLPNQNPKNP